MIKILFFAQLRDVLNTAELSCEQSVASVAELRDWLQQRGDDWREFLTPQRSLVAVNQTMADCNTSLKPGDEVAFFPPVTGG